MKSKSSELIIGISLNINNNNSYNVLNTRPYAGSSTSILSFYSSAQPLRKAGSTVTLILQLRKLRFKMVVTFPIIPFYRSGNKDPERASHCPRTHKWLTDQNLIPSLPDLHALNHSCFLLSKTPLNSGQPHKKLQGVFGPGEAVVNVTSLCAPAADQLMSERQILKAPSLQRVMGTR